MICTSGLDVYKTLLYNFICIYIYIYVYDKLYSQSSNLNYGTLPNWQSNFIADNINNQVNKIVATAIKKLKKLKIYLNSLQYRIINRNKKKVFQYLANI